RAERDATALAAAIGTRIERTTQAVVGTASGASLAGYLVNPPKTSSATARATLLTLATSTDDAVADVMVQDADGDVRIWISGGKLASGDPSLPDDDPVLAGALNLG